MDSVGFIDNNFDELDATGREISETDNAIGDGLAAAEYLSEAAEVVGDEPLSETSKVVMETLLSSIHGSLGMSYTAESEGEASASNLKSRLAAIGKAIMAGVKKILGLASEFIGSIIRSAPMLRKSILLLQERLENTEDFKGGQDTESSIKDFEALKKLPTYAFNLGLVANGLVEIYEKALSQIDTGFESERDIADSQPLEGFVGNKYIDEIRANAQIRLTGIDLTKQLTAGGVDPNDYSRSTPFKVKTLSKKDCEYALAIAMDLVNNLNYWKKVQNSYKGFMERVKYFLDRNFHIGRNKEPSVGKATMAQRSILEKAREMAKFATNESSMKTVHMVQDIMKLVKTSMRNGETK